MFAIRSTISRGLGATAVLAMARSASADNKTTAPKLTYFDVRALAEVSRIICKVGQLEFTDDRLFFGGIKDGKPVSPIFFEGKNNGLFDVNMGRIPIVEANGIKIGQSAVIERYFARKAGLMGASDEEAALIECLVENVNDIKAAFRKIRDMPAGADKDSAMKTWYTTSLSEWLAKLEKSFPSTSSVDCAVGQKMSYADIALWHMCNDFFKFEDVSDACKSHKKISSIVGKVAANPELKKWLNERPVTMF